jgi:hypothetical protein
MLRRSLLTALAAAPLAAQRTIGFSSQTDAPRSECGTGALMPWADALWVSTYNSHKQGTGKGLGLFRIDEAKKVERVHVHDGTHANRLVHKESRQCFIGPYAIDARGNWKYIPALGDDHRLTSTFRHLKDPANLVYVQTMEGLLFELDVNTLQAKLAFDLTKQFNIKARPHFKGGYAGQGRIAVTNNGFYAYGENEAGLFEYDGAAWRALSRKPHMDVAARQDMHNVLFATGWDEASVLFWACIKGQWKRYRLPKASHAFEHAWQTEWMRIREVETEHFLMDIQGMFYELQPMAFEDSIWGVKPVCQHLRIIPDFCSFRGELVLGGNQNSPNNDNNALGGQPSVGLWFGVTDDLWQWGKPQGWGGPWRKQAVAAGEVSDPFLMTGFDKKMLHLMSDKPADVTVEVDFLGNGTWAKYETVRVSGYAKHIFPAGFSAHWVRLRVDASCTMTAEFMYS